MDRNTIVPLLLVAAAVYALATANSTPPEPVCPGPNCPNNPTPAPAPNPTPKPSPQPRPCPREAVASVDVNAAAKKCQCSEGCKCSVCACRLNARRCNKECHCCLTEAGVREEVTDDAPPEKLYGAATGGPVSPAGVPMQCDLPNDQQVRNITSRGEGCCVQTSINHAARFQNVPALVDFQKWVQEKGLPGGASPGRVDERIPACCRDRGYAPVEYLQVEGKGQEIVDIIKLAHKTGRMVSSTYSKSPTGRYQGKTIAHMVSIAHADDQHVAILDNNYCGTQDQYEWMTWDEFLRVANLNGNVWIVILLTAPPPPPPTN